MVDLAMLENMMQARRRLQQYVQSGQGLSDARRYYAELERRVQDHVSRDAGEAEKNVAAAILHRERTEEPTDIEQRAALADDFLGRIESATPFITPPGLAELLAMTDSDAVSSDPHLPFEAIWLDGKFEAERRTYYGLAAFQPAGERVIVLIAIFDNNSGTAGFVAIHDALGEPETSFGGDDRIGAQDTKFLCGVLRNWLLLLQSGQVEQHAGSVPQRIRDIHIRQGVQHPPRSYVEIRVRDSTLQTALDELSSQQARGHYGHAFWVRGHWRTYRAPRYKAAHGQRVWIVPFTKGSGILIEKTYHHKETTEAEAAPPTPVMAAVPADPPPEARES